MKTIRLIAKYLLLLMVFQPSINAQQVNTLYFLDNVPYRNFLNPAFQPTSNFYIGLPVIGYMQFDLMNNSFATKNFVYKQGNQYITFLNENANLDDLFKVIRPNSYFQVHANVNLLNFGFRKGKSYWNFSVTEKTEGFISLPKDFFKLLLYGTPDQAGNKYDFKQIDLNLSNYIETGLGYSRKLNDKWTIGGKLKFLWGVGNVSLTSNKFDLYAGMDKWQVNSDGIINTSLPGTLSVGENFKYLNYKSSDEVSDYLKPQGLGGGLDLGATFQPVEKLTLSLAINDLGFIRWTKGVNNIHYISDYIYAGVHIGSINENTDFDKVWDDELDKLKASTHTTTTKEAYTSYLSPKLNVGAEYGLFKNNPLTIGLLSNTLLHNEKLFEELTASVNVKPISWFNMSISYSAINGQFSNLGFGLGLRAGFLHLFATADYVPLSYAKYTDNSSDGKKSYIFPYNTKGVNFAMGMSFVFGNKKDADHDGISDRHDKCPDTPKGVKVDKTGCPLDTDGDGVPDYLDKCSDTSVAAKGFVDENGCPKDTDGDGVPDYLDKCPDTPLDAKGTVNEQGCPKDTDGDGVPDYLDKCPNTLAEAKATIDEHGCPKDTDGDGVPDYLDKCPNTPSAAKGMVDEQGCPKDTDGDGVPNYLDKCPNTPIDAKNIVDENGCPKDTDSDGVPDYLDKCPNTPSAAKGMVNEQGCPKDTDGDGVPDYLDKCPTVSGIATNNGCPEVKKEVKMLFRKAMQGIQFETGKYKIKPVSFAILNKIAAAFLANPTYRAEVQGHTDNVGNPQKNLTLSDDRAKSVRDFLISAGVPAERLTAKGYGDTKPIASNKTASGKALNRRVEFDVTFEGIVEQK